MTKEITIEDLPGVGPKTAEKLSDSGFSDLVSIATASASEIAAIAEVGSGTAEKVIAAARSALDMGFESGLVALEKRDLIGKISTGSEDYRVSEMEKTCCWIDYEKTNWNYNINKWKY